MILMKNEIVPINVSKSFDEVIRTAEHVYQSTIERRYKSHLIFTMHSLHAKQIINILVENAYRHNTNNTKVSVSAFKNFNGLQMKFQIMVSVFQKRNNNIFLNAFIRLIKIRKAQVLDWHFYIILLSSIMELLK